MPIEIVRLLAFEGPNLLGPRPAILLHARADASRPARLRTALKNAALAVGVVLGELEVVAAPHADEFALTVSFTTPTPALAADLARFVAAGLNAREAGAEEGEDDEQLWELQRRRRAEALPVTALQLLAEAAARGIPAFALPDGSVQLGYGARGAALKLARPSGAGAANLLAPEAIGASPPAPTRAGEAPQVAWERLGSVPIVAVLGGAQADELARAVADGLRSRGLRVASGQRLGFDQARALLASPTAEALVLGLDAGEALRRGLPFDRCAASALLGLPEQLPPEAAGPPELARALGVAMLVTAAEGLALLDPATPELAALAEYAPCRVAPAGAQQEVTAALVETIASQLRPITPHSRTEP